MIERYAVVICDKVVAMRILTLVPLVALAACATTGPLPPAEVIRYHLPAGIERGPATVEPGQAGLMSQPYEAAVARQLAANGYPAAATGPGPFVATVDVRQRERDRPPRRSAFSIGIGGGGFSGGRGGGGVGLGGGVGFPIGGGGRASLLIETELTVLIKRRADQTTVWEGHARALIDPRRRDGNDAATADRLAGALFAGFPGESGRTISVP